MFDTTVKVSLKPGMLNPEATTIQRSLALLGYEVKGTKTSNTISFVIGRCKSKSRRHVPETVMQSDYSQLYHFPH